MEIGTYGLDGDRLLFAVLVPTVLAGVWLLDSHLGSTEIDVRLVVLVWLFLASLLCALSVERAT